MYARHDIPALSSALAMAVQFGNRDEGVAIIAEMSLVEEMERPDFVLAAARRVLDDPEVGDRLCEAFRAGNIAALGITFGNLLEAEARRAATTAANLEF